METSSTQVVGENVLYQEPSDFVSEMLYVHDELVSVPRVLVTNRRIKVGDNSYALQDVVETRTTTELKRMHRSSWFKVRGAWLLFCALLGGVYLGLFDNHRLLLLILPVPFVGLFAYHLGINDEIEKVWIGNLVLVGQRKKTKLFFGGWYQDTTFIGYQMKLKKQYAMVVDGWQKSHDNGSRRAKLIAEAVGAAIGQREQPRAA